MTTPNLFLLYVDDVEASVAFYKDLLGREPAVFFPTFSTFDLGNGVSLGLWARRAVEPKPDGTDAWTEVAIMAEGDAAIEALHTDWKARGLTFAQELTAMTFGQTFVVLDPDGHRIRVCPTDG